MKELEYPFDGEWILAKKKSLRKRLLAEKGEFLHALGKSMINSLVQNSALELASFGIRINAVAPSFVDSEFRKGILFIRLSGEFTKNTYRM